MKIQFLNELLMLQFIFSHVVPGDLHRNIILVKSERKKNYNTRTITTIDVESDQIQLGKTQSRMSIYLFLSPSLWLIRSLSEISITANK